MSMISGWVQHIRSFPAGTHRTRVPPDSFRHSVEPLTGTSFPGRHNKFPVR
jgi:hypothetical protein